MPLSGNPSIKTKKPPKAGGFFLYAYWHDSHCNASIGSIGHP